MILLLMQYYDWLSIRVDEVSLGGCNNLKLSDHHPIMSGQSFYQLIIFNKFNTIYMYVNGLSSNDVEDLWRAKKWHRLTGAVEKTTELQNYLIWKSNEIKVNFLIEWPKFIYHMSYKWLSVILKYVISSINCILQFSMDTNIKVIN